MAGMPRESAFIPTIKCSTCGFQVEITMMGEHVCAGGSSAPPMPTLADKFSVKAILPEKFGRMLPTVDTNAANRSYTGQDQLTPVSFSSGSRSVSPRTPTGQLGSGRSNDYFQPKIASEFESPASQQSRRPGGYGGFDDPDSMDNDSMYPATSPKKQGQSLLQRMDSIAPGPFELRKRAKNAFAPRDNGSNPYDESSSGYGGERPGTSASSSTSGSGGVVPPRLPRKNGYGGFGPPRRDSEDQEPPMGINRAETFPRQTEGMEGPARTPSAPGPRPGRLRRPSNDVNGRPPMTGERSRRPSAGMGPDTSRPPPPRTSLVRPRTAGRDGAAPIIDLAAEFSAKNPYHSASDSVSSSNSNGSSQYNPYNQTSSRTSPARSTGSGPARKAFDPSGFDNLMSDLQSSMSELTPQDSRFQASPMDKALPPLDRSGLQASDMRYDPAIQGPRSQPRNRSPLASPTFDMSQRDDPAIQGGSRDRPRGAPPAADRSPARSGSRGYNGRVPQSSRGDCKACGRAITGKSVSSADGRLTGRYHKACFVCTTCTLPFPSSTFYVMDDKPYCDVHYHSLNGSLCGRCDEGIEGRYLEDEATKKYHPGCFRCGDCGKVLEDGYFEVNEQAYCERDALRRIQLAAPPPMPRIEEPRAGSKLNPAASSRLGPSSSVRGMGGSMKPYGLPSGNRLAPRPRMEKRMTRMGMFN